MDWVARGEDAVCSPGATAAGGEGEAGGGGAGGVPGAGGAERASAATIKAAPTPPERILHSAIHRSSVVSLQLSSWRT